MNIAGLKIELVTNNSQADNTDLPLPAEPLPAKGACKVKVPQQPSPGASGSHACRGGCGGYLHGTCGTGDPTSGNEDALFFHLKKAKMAMIPAHVSVPARQADLRVSSN